VVTQSFNYVQTQLSANTLTSECSISPGTVTTGSYMRSVTYGRMFLYEKCNKWQNVPI